MARKESITIDRILGTAFEMTRESGADSITARHVAEKAGCSTQPIFRVYKNMSELQSAVYEKAVEYFRNYYDGFERHGNVPFTNLGMAYIAFARKEKNLFRLLFVDAAPGRVSMYELLNGTEGNVVAEINLAKELGCTDPGGLFMKMWMLIHGSACMSLTDDYDLDINATRKLLEDAERVFV